MDDNRARNSQTPTHGLLRGRWGQPVVELREVLRRELLVTVDAVLARVLYIDSTTIASCLLSSSHDCLVPRVGPRIHTPMLVSVNVVATLCTHPHGLASDDLLL